MQATNPHPPVIGDETVICAGCGHPVGAMDDLMSWDDPDAPDGFRTAHVDCELSETMQQSYRRGTEGDNRTMALMTQADAARTYDWCLEYHDSQRRISGFTPFKLEKWARACLDGHKAHGGHGILMRRQDGPDGPEYREVERF